MRNILKSRNISASLRVTREDLELIHGGSGHQTIFLTFRDAQQAADLVNLSTCPAVTAIPLLLERVERRVKAFEQNSKRLPGMTRFAALDGSNRTKFMNFWRQSGIKMTGDNTRGWLRSYGAVDATFSHLNALRWQVRTHT